MHERRRANGATSWDDASSAVRRYNACISSSICLGKRRMVRMPRREEEAGSTGINAIINF